MQDNMRNCPCCNRFFPYQDAVKISCGHIVCSNCFELSCKKETIRCPCCARNCDINQCVSWKSVNSKNSAPPVQIENSVHQPLISRVESEIAVLENMFFQTQNVQIDTSELFKQYDLHVRETILHLSQSLEAIQNVILLKVEEISNANQKAIAEYMEHVKGLIEKRKGILEVVDGARNKGENLDFNTQVMVNSLEKVETVELQFYRLEFCYDITEICENLGNSLITAIQFPLDSKKVVAETHTNTEPNPIIYKNNYSEIIAPNINPPPQNPVIYKSSYPEMTMPNKNPPPQNPIIHKNSYPEINAPNMNSLPQDIKYDKSINEPPLYISDPPSKYTIEISKREYRKIDPETFTKKRLPSNDPYECKWYIEVKGQLKPLPKFVCDQIENYKNTKGIIHIKNPKEGNVVQNQVDLKKKLYYFLNSYGDRIPDRTAKLILLE